MNRVLSLLYHEVTDNPKTTGFQRRKAFVYKHPLKEFRQHMEFFATCATHFGKYNDFGERVLVTFDDGGKSNMISAQYLEELNISGHFFIVTSLIGSPHFLSADEIINLHKAGHVIGSHSHTHPNVFKSLTKKQMLSEWRNSKQILEDIIGETIECCSIPGGDANNLAYETAIAAGYKYVFNSDPTIYPKNAEGGYVFGRVSLKAGDSINKVKRLVIYKILGPEKFVRFLKVIIKSAIFPIYSKIHNSRHHEG